MLNDQFIRSIMFDMSKRYTRFVSGVNYLSYGYHGTSILGSGNYTLEYDESEQLYILHITDLNNPLNGNQLFDDDTLLTLESIEELYNITRNEVYYVEDIRQVFHSETDTFSTDVYFQQPNETEDIVTDVTTSQFRYIFNLSSQYQLDNILDQKIECSFDESEDTLFYYLKYNQDSTFDLYSMNLREIGGYIQNSNLNFGDVLNDIQMNDSEQNYQFISYETTLDFTSATELTYKDLTITLEIKPEWNGIYTVDYVLDNIQYQDILYFYVNRLNGLNIYIDEIIGNRNTIHVNELNDILQFDNCQYIFRGKINVEGPLPIVIQDRNNISINGINKSSSILNFKDQDFETNNYQISEQDLPDYTSQIEQFKIIDSTNVTFEDMTFELYNPFLDEVYPVGLLQDRYFTFGIVTQTVDTERTSDKIFAYNIQLRYFNSVLNVDDTQGNIFTDEPQRTDTSRIQFTPRGSELLEDIIQQYNQGQPDIDLSLLPFQDLSIGNGTTETLTYNPEETLHLKTNDSRFLISFDDVNNTVNFNFDNVQDQDHVHDQQDITTGLLSTQIGGLNNDTFTDEQILVYDSQTDKFESSNTVQEIEQQQQDMVQINILNGTNGTEFTLNYNSNLGFKSLNSDLEITYDDTLNRISFNQIVPVKSVNSKTGTIVLVPEDIGQSQDDHLHDDRYLKLIGGSLQPTTNSENLFNIKNSTSGNILRIDSINNKVISDLNNFSLEENKMILNGFSIEVTDTHVIISE